VRAMNKKLKMRFDILFLLPPLILHQL